MKPGMMLAAAGIAAFIGCLPLYAKDYYIAQSAAAGGTGSSCVNALPISWFNDPANWGSGASAVHAGDTVHLCGTISATLKPSGDGAPGAPVTLYFEPNAKVSAPTLLDPSLKTASGIDLNGRHFYVVDGGVNGAIEATSNGTAGANQHSDDLSGISTDHAGDITIRNLAIRGMYKRTPDSNDANKYGCGTWGTSMTGTDIFENNRVTDANCGIQWTANPSTGGTFIVRNNTISRVSWGFASGGGGTVHLKFYGNDLSDGYVWSGRITAGDGHFHNDPFHVWTDASTSFPGLAIYDNWIHGAWGDNTTGAFYFECGGPAGDCPALIYNNIVSTTTGFTNGAIALKYAEHVKIFNNVFACPGNAIQIENWGDASHPSRFIDVENNLFYGVGDALASSGTSTFGTVSHNAYWKTSASGDSPVKGNPKIDPATFRPQAGSPLIERGLDLSAYFNADRQGVPRPRGSAWDIGAFQVSHGQSAQTSESGVSRAAK